MPTRAQKSILVVDDEPEIRNTLTTYLSGEGFAVSVAANGAEMTAVFAHDHVDLVLLDIGLQNESGLDLLKNIITRMSVAVVILTGKSDPIERVVGLELGADDYVVKPFLNRELLARINAVLRRTSKSAAQQEANSTKRLRQIQVNDWLLDLQLRQVQTVGGVKIDLTGIEFDLLAILANNVGEAISRNQLSEATLNRAWEPSDRSLDIHIHNLRRKLSNEDKKDETIVTVRNVGYLLAAEVSFQ